MIRIPRSWSDTVLLAVSKERHGNARIVPYPKKRKAKLFFGKDFDPLTGAKS